MIFYFQIPSKKKIKLGIQNVKSDARLGNLCRAVKRNTDPDAFSHIYSAVFKNKTIQSTLISDVAKILKNKTQLSDLLSEFVILLKLGLL